MPGLPRDLPHLKLIARPRLVRYTNPRRARKEPPPIRDFELHGRTLEASFLAVLDVARPRFADQEAVGSTKGFYLQFELPPNQKLLVDTLENRTKKMELVAVRETEHGDTLTATVFIPDKSAEHYLSRIRQYRQERTIADKPKNEALVSAISRIRLGNARSLFTDSVDQFPSDDNVSIWWEVWVRHGKTTEFRRMAEHNQIELHQEVLVFTENEVLLARATVEQLESIVANSGSIAELRIASDVPGAVPDLPQQLVAAERFIVRRRMTENFRNVAVCVLDSGVNRNHVLLEDLIAEEDLHTYSPAWGVTDTGPWSGHGTGMCGIAGYTDLRPLLASTEEILVRHCLESVKILPNGPDGGPKLYGAITRDSVSRPEVVAPLRKRSYALAVTVKGAISGQPSSWSAAIDELAFGDDERKRLIFVSAGNCRGNIFSDQFPTRNDTEPIENPGQAWNAITVGGFTEKVQIVGEGNEGWAPVSPQGEVSPTSRTSVVWDKQWPIKPEVLFEAGNFAQDVLPPALALDELQLLTTHSRPTDALFRRFGETSCATALASHMSAQLLANDQTLWEETIRALMVHSAEWTPVMKANFANAGTQQAKSLLLRRYGYGVPDLSRAILSTRDDVTLINQSFLRPFEKVKGTIKTRDMAVHRLPWPRTVLQAAGDNEFKLKVTLSYFIEPNPGEKKFSRRHRYRSHGLRFALKRSAETLRAFEARMSSAMRDDDVGLEPQDTGTDNWFLGQCRDVGSIHSDYWMGSGATLALRDSIVVYPVSGWWRENLSLEKFDTSVRYSLIVTVTSQEEAIDIYTPISNLIGVAIEV